MLQHHVVFDDWFTTVSTDEKAPEDDDIEDTIWSELFNDQRFQVHFDDDDPMDGTPLSPCVFPFEHVEHLGSA